MCRNKDGPYGIATLAMWKAPLDHEVYVGAPPGQDALPHGMVYRLQRALYGLKQSPREWNSTLHTFMTEKCGYKQLQSEHCLYIKHDPATRVYVLVCVYVDDLIIAYSDKVAYETVRNNSGYIQNYTQLT